VEHLAALRYIPNNDLWRRCVAVESAVAWKLALQRRGGPSCLIFSRQNLAHQPRLPQQLADIERGGYVLSDPPEATFDVILIATGSEVEIAMAAARLLEAEGRRARVVSMPSTNTFDRQPLEWREGVLPSWCRRRIAVEAGVTDFWRKYVGLDGAVVGIDSFGASAPIADLYKHFKITAEAVVAAAKQLG
jgi:transketolase